mmetsp:Transcript_14023/g.27241  ORF Transcript_14023/g.27241 Transcript_14023/m.27241 type:complete len:239 (-) Transcript_14023:469-1185(-)
MEGHGESSGSGAKWSSEARETIRRAVTQGDKAAVAHGAGFNLKKVDNYYSSTSGAGSGNFHVYRHLRRSEEERLAALDAKAARDAVTADLERRRQVEDAAMKAKSGRRAARRQRIKKQKREAREASKQVSGTEKSGTNSPVNCSRTEVQEEQVVNNNIENAAEKDEANKGQPNSAVSNDQALPDVKNGAGEGQNEVEDADKVTQEELRKAQARAINKFNNDGSFLDGIKALKAFAGKN